MVGSKINKALKSQEAGSDSEAFTSATLFSGPTNPTYSSCSPVSNVFQL